MSDSREFGHARVEPAGAVAGQLGTWRVVYTVGEAGMAVGGALRIRPPQRGMVRWQVGHVIAEASRPGAVCTVQLLNCWPISFHWRQTPIIQVDLWGTALQPGDTITVTIGDRGGYSRGFFRRARAQDFAQDDALWDFWVDVEGNKSVPPEASHNDPWVQLEPFEMAVRPAPPARLAVVVRQVREGGQAARVLVVARDEFDNFCDDYHGTVTFAEAGGEEGEVVRVSGGRAVAQVPAGAGPRYFVARDDQQALIGRSNALYPGFLRAGESGQMTEDFPADGAIYFGDLHVMSGEGASKLGCLVGDTKTAYKWARDVAGLDFCVVTNGLGHLESDLRWDEDFYEPGEFVTIPAAEVYFKTGHKNVYFATPDDALPPPDGSSPQALFASLEGRQAMVIPHHPNIHSESSRRTYWDVYDYSTHDPRWERLIEITQDRGSFEVEEVGGNVYFGGYGSSVWSALQRGMKVGFVGGTDTHRARPGEWRSPQAGLDLDERPVVGGLTAVLARELTREAVWEALWARRCYATQGQRTLVNFSLGPWPMGSVLGADRARQFADARQLRFRVQGHRRVAKVQIVRSDGRVFDVTGPGEPGWRTVDDEFVDNERLENVKPAGDAVFYYLRVTEDDGRMAWASPIWLKVR